MPSRFDEAALIARTPAGEVAEPLRRWPDPEEALAVWGRLAPAFAHPVTWQVRPPKHSR